MKIQNQEIRRRQIEEAAYELLAENGYKATSMLAIAKKAAASNETLYKWYGNKQSLFMSLVQENARAVRELLSDISDDDPINTMKVLGPQLLRLVTSERAVALNRAAVGDVHDSAVLGKTIARGGRDSVAPLIAQMFERARELGLLSFDDAEEVAGTYISLLIGDLQIQRAIGARGPLKPKEIKTRAERAGDLIMQIYAKR